MTDTNHTDSVEALVKELRMVADMINMGEKIQWGRETTLMDKAADMLETHLQELQKARHDWLREEIVKLEGMKVCPSSEEHERRRDHSTKSGYETALDDAITALQELIK